MNGLFLDIMTDLTQLVGDASDMLWSSVLLILLVGVGLFYSLYLGFPQITQFGRAMKETFGGIFAKKDNKEGSMSSFQALATAIAAQVGTGNVAGVATAIIAGGPGAIFWMWLSAFLGMSTIFGEAILAQRYRVEENGELVGGPAYYIDRGLKAKPLAIFFSIAIILALGFVGNLVQSNSISVAVHTAAGLPPMAIGVVIAICAALVFMGGMKRIASFAELVVPFMAILYIIGSIAVMVIFGDKIIPTIQLIFSEAFNVKAAGGGLMGVAMVKAIRFGVARGLFSNEAGMGSTPHAHAVADVKHPAQQGLVAIAGVIVDTVVVCTATAMVILVTGAHTAGLEGAAVTQEGFNRAFGTLGANFLAICLTFFAFTTIIGWYYFGESNVRYLTGKKGLLPYRVLVILFILAGAALTQEVDFVWKLADFFNAIMVFPNLVALLFLAPQVKKIYKNFRANREYLPEMDLKDL